MKEGGSERKQGGRDGERREGRENYLQLPKLEYSYGIDFPLEPPEGRNTIGILSPDL